MIVWHYTDQRFVAEIFEAGELRPAHTVGLYGAPLLWFSADQQWEPMATMTMLTPREEAVRFGIDASDPRLLNWKATCDFVGRTSGERKHYEKVYKKCGANATHWRAAPEPIPLEALTYQTWRIGAGWRNAYFLKDHHARP